MSNPKHFHPPRRSDPTVGVIIGSSFVALLLVLTGCRGDTHADSVATPTVDMLRRVIVGHYHAIEGNRLDEAMEHYHSRSPEVTQTKRDVELGLSQFLLKTTTVAFCTFGRDQEIATARVKHRHLAISGIKFAEYFVDVEYQLRAEQGEWKIWTKQNMPVLNVEESCSPSGGSNDMPSHI